LVGSKVNSNIQAVAHFCSPFRGGWSSEHGIGLQG
jgi:hypothetical protein